MMLLSRVVETSAAVAATRSRKVKTAAVASLLRAASADEIGLVVRYLAGVIRQRRTGVGWRSLADLPPAAAEPILTVVEVDAALEALAALSGSGSAITRTRLLADLLGRATASEQDWLRQALLGGVLQGARESLVEEGLAAALDLPLAEVRRAAMYAGGVAEIAPAAATGGADALAAIGLTVHTPVLPMLASSAPDVASALVKAGGGEVAVDAKLDGIRLQVHADPTGIRLMTRSLDDITERLPEVVEVVGTLPIAQGLVLDGEALLVDAQGRPRPFQETSSRTASLAGERVTPYFFDVLHVGGRDVTGLSGRERNALLDQIVPPQHRVRRLVTGDPDAAAAFADEVLAAGHEGVVVKSLDAAYEAGRRGSAWVKVKPVHTLDLVVLAVEWGSGRRQGWLSNIHLGARDPATGEFVMVGKTFKGMTDAMLAWQTARFTELQTRRTAHTVFVRPEQVVEIALDGVQRSRRYPGGVALRFARVVRYRDDKIAAEADTIDAVRDLLP